MSIKSCLSWSMVSWRSRFSCSRGGQVDEHNFFILMCLRGHCEQWVDNAKSSSVWHIYTRREISEVATPLQTFATQWEWCEAKPDQKISCCQSTSTYTVNFVIGVPPCRSEFIRELFWSLILFMLGIRGWSRSYNMQFQMGWSMKFILRWEGVSNISANIN